MAFTHPIFTTAVSGGGRLASRAAQVIFRELGNAAVQMAAESVVGLVAETAQQAAAFSLETIESLSTEAMAALMGVHCPGINDDRVIRNDAVVNRMLNVLAERPNGPIELAEQFELRQRNFQFEDEVAQQVSNIHFPGGCALGILRAENDVVASKKFPDGSGAPRRIRQCVRRSTDGQRVSREVHEWEYVRQNQWGDLLAEVRQWGERVVAADEAGEELGPFEIPQELGTVFDISDALSGNVSFATRDYTFGNFVDAVQMRKGIEQLRRVNRAVTGERFTDLFRLLNVSRDETVSTINNSTNWGRQFLELIRLNVQPDSGQSGSIT